MSDAFTPPCAVVTKDDIDALRKAVADGSYDRRYALVARLADDDGVRTGSVTFIKEIDLGQGYDPRYASERREIEAHATVDTYDGRTFTRCVASSSHYKTDPVQPLTTLASLLKPGDWLRVHFRLGNTNEKMKEIGLTHDESYIIVMRGRKLVGTVAVDDITTNVGSLALFSSVRS